MLTSWLVVLGLGTALAQDPSITPRPWAGLVTEADPHWDLELLYSASRYDEGLKAAKVKQAANPSDPEIYWHIARFIFEKGETIPRSDTTVDKEAMYQEMLDWSDKGLKLAPNHMHLKFARGIAMGRLGTTRGVLSSLGMADDIESEWLAVGNSTYRYASTNEKEILPCDAWQALGIFYRLVPESWLVQAIAGTRGDIGKSVEVLEKASKCAPGLIRSQKELGVAQLCYGERRNDPAMAAKGRQTIAAMVSMPPRYEVDRIDIRHGHMLLANPGLACEYSRDGQQDLDESKLKQP